MNNGPYVFLLAFGAAELISVAIGTVALVFASRLIFKRKATWLSAFLGSLASGFLLVALPFAANSMSSGFSNGFGLPLFAMIVALVIPGAIYAAVLRSRDGARFTLVESYVLYLVQLVTVFVASYALGTLVFALQSLIANTAH